MPKHEISSHKQEKESEKYKTHPVWRGVGCVMIILIPIISYALSILLFTNRSKYSWFIVPDDIVISKLADPYIFVKILYAGIFTFVLGILFAGLVFILDKFFGPPKYGPFDVKR